MRLLANLVLGRPVEIVAVRLVVGVVVLLNRRARVRDLAALRKSKGLTKDELARLAASSQRMIAHYETTPYAEPPASLIAALAKALSVSADELLGLKPLKEEGSTPSLRLRKRLLRAEKLPERDQKTLLRLLDALLTSRKAS